MTTEQEQGKGRARPEPEEAPRGMGGLRAVSALVPKLTRPAFRRRAPASAQLLADWEVIVGPAIAAAATPRKLFAGTLSIACAGAVAMELQHLSASLIERINLHLGRVAVSRLRFVGRVESRPAPVPVVRPQAREAARAAVAGVPEGGLKDALEALGRMVLTRDVG